MRILISLFIFAFLFSITANAQLKTPAEKTNYQNGGTKYESLMDYIHVLDSKTELMSVQKLTTTILGRDVVLCILSDAPIYKPSDINKIGKSVLLISNNVHGGEVAGKEASLELMRDLTLGNLRPLLKNTVVLIIPSLNPDGAEVGRRTNEQHFDMNRDYLKLESQEINALIIKVINTWQPDIHIDTHHGGSDPYTLTYQTCMNPAGDSVLIKYGNDNILSKVREKLRTEDYDGFWYSGGRWNGNEAKWTPTSVEPRKQHVYSALTNTLAFLFETPRGNYRLKNNGTVLVEVPKEEKFKHQVRGEYLGLLAILEYASDNTAEIIKLIGDAKLRAIENGNNDSDMDQIPLAYEQVKKFDDEFWIRKKNGKRGEYEKVTGGVYTKFTPIKTTIRPWAYIMPPEMAYLIPILAKHDITIKKIYDPIELEVESYQIKEVKENSYYQGHYLKQVIADKKIERVKFSGGSFIIPTGQPRSNLLCYLLEPETNDNLITWGYLDYFIKIIGDQTEYFKAREKRIKQNKDLSKADRKKALAILKDQQENPKPQQYPIYRLMKKTPLKSTIIEANFNTLENQFIK